MIELTQDAFVEKISDLSPSAPYKGSKPAVVDFYAPWCGPCKVLAPRLEKLQQKYGDKIDFFKVNVDDEYAISNAFGILAVPTLAFFSPSKKVQTQTGSISPINLEKAIDSLLDVI